MTTRTARLEHCFRVLELADEVSTYLRDILGTRTAARLAAIMDADLSSAMADEGCPLTEADRKEIVKFRWWYRQWSTNPEETRLLEESLTIDMWDRILYDPAVMETQIIGEGIGVGAEVEVEEEDMGRRNYFRVRADIRQFRRFNGTMGDYTAWKRGFIATGTAQGLGRLFDPEYESPNPNEDGYGEFEQMNSLLYAALVVATAEGTAILIIDQARASQDGIGAWRQLIEWLVRRPRKLRRHCDACYEVFA